MALICVYLVVLFQVVTVTFAQDVQYHYGVAATPVIKDGRISGMQDRKDKDIILGGLFSVHYDGVNASNEGVCGQVIWDHGMQMLEAMLYAIDVINSDPDLLPNITLGFDIRDTCKRENVALDETIDFVFSNGQLELESCHSLIVGNISTSAPVSAVLGGFESFISIPVAGFLRLFEMPQISYGSSSTVLNNRERYTYFYRTFPPDDNQAGAMVDLILYFGWDHVSTINSNNLYGQPGIEQFHKLAKDKNICIDLNEAITDEFESSDYRALASKLINSTADIVVLFASAHHAESILTALRNLQLELNKTRHFLWLASDAWAEIKDPQYSEITAGRFGFIPLSETIHPFNDYFSKLLPNTNLRNPWFKEFYKQVYKCSINCSNVSLTDHSEYKQFSVVPLVIDAVYSVAHALNDFFNDNCNKPLIWFSDNQTCLGQTEELSGKILLEYIKNVSFTSPTGNKVKFDDKGNVEAKYRIWNYQVERTCQTCSNIYKLVNVGYWDATAASTNRLKLNPNVTKQFGFNESGDIIDQLNSQCQACSLGFIKREVVASCCGTCDPCLGQNYTNTTSSKECQICPQYMWGNGPLTGSNGCVDIGESYLKPSDGWSIVLILLAIIGLLAVVFVSGVFMYFWNTPIVKSSGREQMVLLLSGITLCFLITVVFIPKPSVAVCTLQRIGAWFCFSLIVCAVFIKLVRITRIFLQKTVSSRPKFISPMHQILFTFLLVGVQMVFELISLIVTHPNVAKNQVNDTQNTNNFPILALQCTTPHIAILAIQMLYFSALMIASNALAVLTIRFPQNFNESKYVAFSTFSLGLIWIAFIITFLTTDAQFQPAVISLAIQLSALAVLVCLFGPRIFIMIFWPDRNVLTTTTASPSGPTSKSFNVPSENHPSTNTNAVTFNLSVIEFEDK